MFNVGGKVKCIREGGGLGDHAVIEDNFYTINRVWNEFVSLDEMPNQEKGYFADRFVLIPVAIPKAKKKAPVRKPGEFFVGDSIIIVSNNDAESFYASPKFNEHVGKVVVVTDVDNNSEEKYKQIYCSVIDEYCYLDSRQCRLALRKDGKPRKIRKPAAPKKPKTFRNIGKELDRRCETAFNSCCHYAVQYADETDWNVSAACYASLNYEECLKQGIKAVWENLSNHHRNHPNKPAYERFVNYILCRSPFKDGFKPVKGANKNKPWLGSIEWNVNKHGRSYLVTCALALREGSEYPEQLKVWEELVDKGYSEDVAWFISGFIRKTGIKYSLHKASTHACRHYQMSYAELLKVIQVGLPEYKQAPMAKKNTGRYVIHSNLVKRFQMDLPEEQVYNVFNKNIKTKEVGEGWYKETQMEFKDICEFADKLTSELKETK